MLENDLLLPIKEFKFSEFIIDSLPNIKLDIKEQSKKKLLLFLEKAREEDEKIGHLAIQNSLYISGFISTTNINEKTRFLNGSGIWDILDFKILQRYMLIIEETGYNGKDENYYKMERNYQVKLLYDWIKPSTEDSFISFNSYILRIIGFFIIESFVSNTFKNTFSKNQLNEMFERCIQRLAHQLKTQCNLKTIENVLEFKKLLKKFVNIMMYCELSSSNINECIKIIKFQYNEIIAKNSREKLNEFLNVRKLIPLVINNLIEQKKIFNTLPLPNNLNNDNFPKTFPFSLYVPSVYNQVLNYIELSLSFDDNHLTGDVEIEYDMKIAAKHFFNNVIKKNILNILKNCSNVAQFIQLYYDIYFLDSYLVFLDTIIPKMASTTDLTEDSNYTIILKNENVFKSLETQLEQSLTSFIVIQLDPLLKTLLKNTQEHPVYKTIEFLLPVINLIKRLPNSASHNIFLQIIKYINNFIIDELKNVKTLQKSNYESFYKSVTILEEFIFKKVQISDFADDIKQLLLIESKQTLHLLVTEDWEYFFTNYEASNHKENKYHYVNLNKLIIIYSKYVLMEIFSYCQSNLLLKNDIKGVFQSIFKNEKKQFKPVQILERLNHLNSRG